MTNFSEEMIAPCGINCSYCKIHLSEYKPCSGCRMANNNTPESSMRCEIRECVILRGLYFCFECNLFPCKLNKHLENTYKNIYKISLIENLNIIKEHGLKYFLDLETNQNK